MGILKESQGKSVFYPKCSLNVTLLRIKDSFAADRTVYMLLMGHLRGYLVCFCVFVCLNAYVGMVG